MNGVQETLDFRPPAVAPWLTPSRSMSRAQWLAECEQATHRVRLIRAAEYERAGERSLEWWQLDGFDGDDSRVDAFAAMLCKRGAVTPIPDDYWNAPHSTMPLPVPKWHADRAEAQRDRWSLLNTCGAKQLTLSCDCGGSKPRSNVLRCDHWRLCIECRGRRKAKYQARFTLGRKRTLRRMGAFTNRRNGRREGRWSEKMMTLPVPHSGSVSADIRVLTEAWPRLRARIARYIWRRSGKTVKWGSVPYWRSLEVTPSDHGHAHYHLWLMVPYIPQRLLAHWWALSLPDDYRARVPRVPLFVSDIDERDRAECWRASRGTGGMMYRAVVDLRAADESARGEIVKYLVKDCIGDPSDEHFIEPRAYAPIYGALDGARAVATSVRFVPPHEPAQCWCDSCGQVLVKKFEQVPIEGVADPPQ